MSFLADKATVQARREVCAKCPWNTAGWVPTCRACGCVLATKTAMADAECPKRYWSWQGDKTPPEPLPLRA
jgi:hypothetical protein